MHIYEEGKLYNPNRTSWPQANQYNYRTGAHELLLFLTRPRSEEISSVRRGPAEFALFVEGPVILLLYRFLPGLPWSDAPYSIHLVLDEERTVPELPSPFLERNLVHTILIDAATGIIRAMRSMSFSPDFTAELHLAIRAQAEMVWNRNQYDAALQSIYARYPKNDAMLTACAARCKGGA